MKVKSRETRARRGRVGGLIAASRMTDAERSARATKGGTELLNLYGIPYYSALGKLSGRRRAAKAQARKNGQGNQA